MKENWYLQAPKDPEGLYSLRRSVNHGKSFTVAILFNELHEYPTRYELLSVRECATPQGLTLRSGKVIAIVYKKNARINGISALYGTNDYKEIT